jgi:hypothetical protein
VRNGGERERGRSSDRVEVDADAGEEQETSTGRREPVRKGRHPDKKAVRRRRGRDAVRKGGGAEDATSPGKRRNPPFDFQSQSREVELVDDSKLGQTKEREGGTEARAQARSR